MTEKMIVHLNVLSLGMEDGVLRELDVAEVVTVDRRQIRHLLLQILKQSLQPYGLACRNSRFSILGFSAQWGNCRLLLATPRDRATPKREGVCKRGSAISGIASPISIGVADQLHACTGPI